MLPSTGYFKSIICPFYENGCCDRPYCHFKHLRRDDGTASSASAVLATSQAQTAETTQKTEAADVVKDSDTKAEIHQLVNEAVMKLLESQKDGDAKAMTDKIVAQVVEKLKPSIVSNSSAASSKISSEVKVPPITIGKHSGVPSCVTKPSACVYNPTPISELKKRHIPVPVYMPTRDSKVAVKRKSSTDAIVKPWPSMLRESTNSNPAEMTYKPTAIVNIVQDKETSSKTYVPTLRSDNSSSNSHDDGNSNDYVPKSTKEAYYPKAKKRREEYVPKKVKAPLKAVQQLDDTVLDEFEPEFDMIDEILTSTAPVETTITTNTTTTATMATIVNDDETVVINDDFVDLYEIERKFSDDDEEIIDKVSSDTSSTKELQSIEIDDEDANLGDCKENENSDDGKSEVESKEKSKSHRSGKRKLEVEKSSDDGRRKEKSRRNSNDTNMERKKEKKRRDSSKSEGKKEDAEIRKKEHKSSSSGSSVKNKERRRSKDEKSDCKDNRKSTRDKKNSSSSSNKDKDRCKDSHSGDGKRPSSHRSKDRSRSIKEKVPGPKNDDEKSRDKTRHRTKHGTSSSTSSKVDKSHGHRSASKKSSSSSNSRKTSGTSREKKTRKESSSETSFVEQDDHSFSPFESLLNDESMDVSDSDHDVEEECLKIFQEYEPSDHPKGVTRKETPKNLDTEDVEDVGKKRVAHPLAADSIVRAHGPSQPPKKIRNSQQVMYDRWRAMKDAAAEKSAQRATAAAKMSETLTTNSQKCQIDLEKTGNKRQNSIMNESSSGNTMANACNAQQVNGNGANRIRIAHVPYAMALALMKKKVNETKAANDAKAAALEAKTAAQTAKGSRVAHIPQVVPQLVAPEPMQVATQKFPLTVRQHYVNLMHVICVQIYTNGEDAAQRAVREELACHDRCKALPVYKNSCMLATHRLRKEVEQGTNGEDSLPSASGLVSHNSILAGKSKGSWSVEKTKKSVMDFRGVALYERLRKWIATEEQLRDNGFPRSHPDGPKGRAKVYAPNTRNHSILSKVPNERYCCRCGKAYTVNKHGMPVQQQNCIYHWGRKFTTRGESKYTCCQQYGFASGCSDAKYHVWEYVDYENLRGYVKTLPKDGPPEEQGVYALDCEMSYTTQGLELTRVTVINEDCNTIYETLVMPENPIMDYNTRFSGITEENMKGVTTTLLDVQATLLTMFTENTILVGHSLESDFKALKLIHDTVVDTSIMFPHKNGLPHKRALRNLCSELLRKIIQNEVGGHDSTEDAVACMDLIHWKVKEEAKLQ